MRHLTSAACELRFQRIIGNLPARASAWADPQLDQSMLAPFAQQMAQPATVPQVVEWERIQAEVQIVADKRTPYRTLIEVVYTCGQAEFKNVRFVVVQTGQGHSQGLGGSARRD